VNFAATNIVPAVNFDRNVVVNAFDTRPRPTSRACASGDHLQPDQVDSYAVEVLAYCN